MGVRGGCIVICMTVSSDCITVTSSTEVFAAVVHRKIRYLKREVVLGSIDGRPEVVHRLFVFGQQQMDLSSGSVLSVPEHGVAAHAEARTRLTQQGRGDSRLGEQILRLEDGNRESCRAGETRR